MNLLAIETSSSVATVAVATTGGRTFNSTHIDHDPRISVSHLVALGLSTVGIAPGELDRIAVDIGPGGLSAVRAGVSFANALAFAIDRPLYGFTCFEVAARQVGVSEAYVPVVTAIPAAGGHAYLGLIDEAGGVRARYGVLEEIMNEVLTDRSSLKVVGRLRGRVRSDIPGLAIIDTGIEILDPEALLALCREAAVGAEVPGGVADPLNERSGLFHG